MSARVPGHVGQLALLALDRLPGGIRVCTSQISSLVIGGDNDERLAPAALTLHPVDHGLNGFIERDLLLNEAVQAVAMARPVDRTAFNHEEHSLIGGIGEN